MSTPLVLIVEDDPWFAQQQKRTLELAGYQVALAENGLEAIRRLDGQAFDAVVLDVFLPGPNAFTLLHEVQSYVDLAAIPVIICSTSAPSIDPADVEPYGVHAVLDKTAMKPSDLVAAVHRVV